MDKNRDFCGCNNKLEFDIHQIKEVDCIIVDKVYAQCQNRECFTSIEIDTGDSTFRSIKFEPGFIIPGTLSVEDIPNKPHFKRVRFKLRIPYVMTLADGSTIEGNLPDIDKDIILFIPEARDEFQFEIVIETSSSILGQPIISEGKVTFAVGVFVIIKVVGRVQLLIPTFGFCPEPPQCVDFSQDNICEDFDCHPFPLFFPLQYGDLFEDE